jgi:lysyl-tRNA synthetase class I
MIRADGEEDVEDGDFVLVAAAVEEALKKTSKKVKVIHGLDGHDEKRQRRENE